MGILVYYGHGHGNFYASVKFKLIWSWEYNSQIVFLDIRHGKSRHLMD